MGSKSSCARNGGTVMPAATRKRSRDGDGEIGAVRLLSPMIFRGSQEKNLPEAGVRLILSPPSPSARAFLPFDPWF
jgi:hypothetical protein